MTQKPTLQQINECANEQIQIPGFVQPHGLLISLRATDFTILQVSKNVFDLLGVDANELLHQPLSYLMDVEPVRQAVKRLVERTPRLLNPIPLTLTVNGRAKVFDGILHRSGRVINLELEPHIGSLNASFGGFYESVRDVAARLFNAFDPQDASEVVCDEIRKLTGFDRVMMYKFDADWNGTVIAESVNDGVDGYLNHRFPASDIPEQARALYTVNWLRIIPDVNYTPSPIIPTVNPLTDRPLDLMNSVLRSVSPVHIEYMKNMGLGASMSISVLRGRKLWGLVSCHHLTSHFLSYDVRVACEFIAQTLSGLIESREQTAEFDHKLQLKTIYTHLLAAGGSNDDLTLALERNASSLLALTESQGAAICLQKGCTIVGRAPSRDQVVALVQWLGERGKDFYMTNELSKDYPPAENLKSVASGLMAISIPRAGGGWILWFRPERNTNVIWGGNPEKAKTWSEEEGRFRPRQSFQTWVETSGGQSIEWAEAEVEVATEFRQAAIGLASRSAINTTGDRVVEVQQPVVPHDSFDRGSVNLKDDGSAGPLDLIDGFADLSLALLDHQGLIRSWSEGATRMLGYPKSEIIGKPVSFLFPESDALRDRLSDLMKLTERDGRLTEELWLYRKNGSSFWAKIGLNKNQRLESGVGSYSLIIENYTEAKGAEEELKATKVAAEAANRTKSAFLANISHEIRTPLGAVLGFSELMNAPGQSDTERSALYERVKRNGHLLTALINDLLDMSKAEAGRLEVEMLDFDFKSLVHDIEQTFGLRAGEKNIKLDFKLAPNVPSALRSDPTRIRQILNNLLSNAMKFTNDGGSVAVALDVKQENATKFLEIRVTDSGRGMSDEEQSRLFQPFAQADASMTRKFGGTGLGLFVSRRLARGLGGDMSIETSALGKGTTFLTRIDITQGPSQAAAPIAQPIAPPSPAKTALNGMKILLVDDSSDNRDLISIFLKGAGATVATAENGRIGVEKAAADTYDAVLMDIQMPVMDGYQAIQSLNRSGYKKPIVALTAHAMKEEREHALSLGFSGYLTKPINRGDLIATLAAYRQ